LQDKGIVDEINILLLKMHENSMKHNDLHNGNIMIGYTKKADDATSTKQVELINDRVWIIDHSGIKPNDDSPLTHLHIEWNDD
jgi:predicted unusual protein kinase regulating ubiquinone biosynthesis (AarF/ABC1/UbiB family)